MFDELVKHAKRLFSSKSNAGKLVKSQTDRLHSYKQVLLALSIVLLLGYSQFRDNFKCNSVGTMDTKSVTNFCWTNGTTTVNLKESGRQLNGSRASKQRSLDPRGSLVEKIIPHVGIQFRWNDRKYEVINHNYMRSLWALLILLAACSYLGQRAWSSIFADDILRALLKLPNHETLTIVQSAQKAKGFETLMKLPSPERREKPAREVALVELFEKHNLFESINLIDVENEYNHLLDYYPNQLIYLLLANKASVPSCRLSKLRLKYKLFTYQLLSSILTGVQFLLPLLSIGPKYKLYGWHYLEAWLGYLRQELMYSNNSEPVNTIDYELSARIWPTVTQCTYRQPGMADFDSLPTQCMVAINEICGKLFVAIWWFVAVNMIIELYHLGLSLANLFAFRYLLLRRQLSGECRRALREIARFRRSHSELLDRILRAERGRLAGGDKVKKSAGGVRLAVGGCKPTSSHQQPARARKGQARDEDTLDEDIYFYFQLLYLRLDCSRRQTSEVIMMTSEALRRYMENLRRFEVNSQGEPLLE